VNAIEDVKKKLESDEEDTMDTDDISDPSNPFRKQGQTHSRAGKRKVVSATPLFVTS
jgi:hypothetical protein